MLFDKLIEKTPLYSKLGVEYQQAYSGPYEDLSYSDDDVLVIAGLKGGRISGFGRPMVALGEPKALKTQMQRLYNISNDIFLIEYLEGGTVSAAAKFLLQKGLAARPFYTQIIDLTKTEEQLHADLRKSYKQLVKQGEPQLSIVQVHKDIHFKMHGRATRSKLTWQIQDQMFSRGELFVIADKWKTSSVMICSNSKSAYYFSSASKQGENTHHLIWAAIITAKELGCKTLDMGEQVLYHSELYQPLPNGYPKMKIYRNHEQHKRCNISLFKAGFGGRCYARLLVGE